MEEYCHPNQFCDLADDAAMLQAAVDQARQTGQIVLVPAFNQRTGQPIWRISRAIELYSGSSIILAGAHLRLEDGVYCNIFKNSHNSQPEGLLQAGRQSDIRIMGQGNAVLDGGEHNGLTEKTQGQNGLPSIIANTSIHFHNVERLTIANLRIINQRYWGMTFHYCSEGRISNIEFMAHNNAPNQDGIDLRSGCSRFIIENITGCTGDDTIALTALDGKTEGQLRVEDADPSIHSVIIRNVSTYVTGNHAIIRLLNHGGRKIYNVIIENILDRSDGVKYRPGAAVRIGELHYYSESGMARPGDTWGITVRNVKTCARFGVFIACTLQDSLLENIQLFGSGGTAVFFSGGSMRNIKLENIHYTMDCASSETSLDGGVRFKFDQLCAVYFNESDCQNLLVRDLTAGQSLQAVFGGSGPVQLEASGVRRLNDETKLVSGGTIKAKIN